MTTGEKEALFFDVEKSNDGINFSVVVSVNSYNDYTSEQNIYSFPDPERLNGRIYYRIKMRNQAGQSRYSRIIQLSVLPKVFSFASVTNPFNRELTFDISSDLAGRTDVRLIDQFGKTVKRKTLDIISGLNHLSLGDTEQLPSGVYIIRMQLAEIVIQKKVVKQPE